MATTTVRTGELRKRLWIICGPAGSGKTSVAECLQNNFNLAFLEGDTFHTPQNVQKMASGQPLTDADRWEWLVSLREAALKQFETHHGVIVTCSALKKNYRDVFRVLNYFHLDIQICFLLLGASEAVLTDRVKAREGHYMKDFMVHSQLESLEAPLSEEIDVTSIDASGGITQVQALAMDIVRRCTISDQRRASATASARHASRSRERYVPRSSVCTTQ